MKFEQGKAPAVLFDKNTEVWAFCQRLLETDDQALAARLLEAGAILLEGEVVYPETMIVIEPDDEEEDKGYDYVTLPFDHAQMTKTEIAEWMYDNESGYDLDTRQTKVEMVEECIDHFFTKQG